MRKRHHVVSRGYQRFFADGERILLVEKEHRRAKVVGTRDAFLQKHFNSFGTKELGRVDSIEDQWTRLEGRALPSVASLVRGDRSAENRMAVKILAAMHFARGFGFQEAAERIVAESKAQAPARASKPAIQDAWREQYRREPEPGEIEAYIAERAEELFSGRRLVIDRMGSARNAALDKLGPLYVQLIVPATRRVDFITGDVPFVHSDGIRAGLRQRLALGDAGQLYMPLSPRLAVMFTTQDEGDVDALPARLVQTRNLLVWQAAYRYVACPRRPMSACLLAWRSSGSERFRWKWHGWRTASALLRTMAAPTTIQTRPATSHAA